VLLEQAREVWLKNWPVWLAGVPSNAGEREDLRPLLGAMIQEMFREVVEEGTSFEVLGEAAVEVRRLCGTLPADDRLVLGHEVMAALEKPATDDQTATVRWRRLETAARLADHGLLDRSRVVQAEFAALRATFADLTSGTPLLQGELADYLVRSVPATINGWTGAETHRDLSNVEIRTLIQELDGCQAIAAPLHMRLRLEARVAALVQGLRTNAPRLDEVVSLLADPGVEVVQLVSDWLRVARPSASELSSLLKVIGSDARTNALLALFAERRRELPAAEQRALVQEWTASPSQQLPPENLCQALGIADIDDAAAADVIIERYQASTANDARQSAFRLWRYADITNDPVRRRLFEQVLIPHFGLGSQATRSGLDLLPALARTQPRGTKGPLQAAVEQAVAKDPKLRDKALETMERIGYATERSGMLGLGKRKLRKGQH
jgi:hypothetical protein